MSEPDESAEPGAPASDPAAPDESPLPGAITAEERGDTSVSRMSLSRVVMVLGTAVLVVGIVVGGNVLSGGRLPWATDDASAGPSAPATAPAAAPSASASAAPVERSSRGLTALGDTIAETTHSAAAILVATQDARLTAVARLTFDDPAVLGTWGTVVLSARDAPYGLADLVASGAVRQDDPTTYTLLRHVVVRQGARLQVDAPGATLRMTSGPGEITSIVGWGGIVALNGTAESPLRITSWDPAAATSDTDVADGRAFVLVRNGRLESSYTHFTDLGFWSGRTGGVAVTTTSGGGTSAAISHTEHTGLHYGLYLESVSDTTVTGTTIRGSQQSGIDVTTGSVGVAIDGVVVEDAGHDGIDIERGSTLVSVQNTTVRNSAGFGIRLDGAALGDGPTAPGYLTVRAAGFELRTITMTDNGKGGVSVVSGNNVTIADASVTGAAKSIDIAGPAHTVTVTGSTLTSDQAEALVVSGDVTDAVVRDSTLTGHTTAVDVTGATIGFEGDTLAVDEGTALRASGDAVIDGSGNRLDGTGQDAILVLDEASVALAGTDTSSWRFAPGVILWLNHHPIAWLWIAVLIIPAVGLPLLIVRARKHRELRRMLEDAIVRHGRHQLAAYAEGAPPPELVPARAAVATALDPAAVPAAAPTAAAVPAPAAVTGPSTIPDATPPASPATNLATSPATSPAASPALNEAAGSAQDAAARRAAAFRAELARTNHAVPPPLVGRPESMPPRRPTPEAPAPRNTAPRPAATGAGPRSLQDLRAMLSGREFASMQQFAVAAVIEAGYSPTTIARLFRVPAWRIDQWVQEALAAAERPAPPPRHWTR